jgi:hypothetical protein
VEEDLDLQEIFKPVPFQRRKHQKRKWVWWKMKKWEWKSWKKMGEWWNIAPHFSLRGEMKLEFVKNVKTRDKFLYHSLSFFFNFKKAL